RHGGLLPSTRRSPYDTSRFRYLRAWLKERSTPSWARILRTQLTEDCRAQTRSCGRLGRTQERVERTFIELECRGGPTCMTKPSRTRKDHELEIEEDADCGSDQTQDTEIGCRGDGNGRGATRVCLAGWTKRSCHVLLRKRPGSHSL